jgi:hypothetical protein
MMRKGWFLVVACVAALTVTSNAAQAGGHVYALRGLINVFSYGMDTMVDKCKKRGVAASAHGHGDYPTLAAEAAAKVKSGKGPIIIIGHSYGADAAVSMANEMKKLGAPVALLVLYGPTIDPLPIPSNVRAVVNYYQTSNAAWRGKAVPGAGFTGSINNVNLDKADDVTHFNIEKLDRLQNQAMGRIVALTGTGRPIPSDTPTTASASGDPATTPSRATTGSRTTAAPARTATTPASTAAATATTTATTATAAPSAPAGSTAAATPAATQPAARTATATPSANRAPKPKQAASSTKTTVDTPASHGAY